MAVSRLGMRLLLAVATLVFACKKESAIALSPSPKPPASTTEQDALWKLAPDGTAVGVVLSSRGLDAVEHGWLAIRSLLAAPEYASLAGELDAELEEMFGTNNVSLAALGLAPGKGFAAFGFDDGSEVVILPVVDRAKLVAALKGSSAGDVDTIGDHVCKTVQNVYACAKPADLLTRLGKAPMTDKIKQAGARGDIEFVGIADGIEVSAVAWLDRGSVLVRGVARGVSTNVTSKLRASGTSTVDANRTAGFAVLHLAPIIAGALPSEPIAPGVTLADLGASIGGPVTVSIAAGSPMFDARVPLKDTAPAKQLVEHCDAVPPLAAIGASVTNGRCHVSVPELAMDVEAWIDGNDLHIGKSGAPVAAVALAPTAAAKELANGEWALAMYGRGTLFGEGKMPPMPIGTMPEDVQLAIRAVTMVNEIGIGVRADGDAVWFLATVRTAWSNPDDVVAKLLAIRPEQIIDGKASAAAKEIAQASPSSPFASDFKLGIGGVMIPAATIGVLAAVAIPAFVEYRRKTMPAAP